MKLIPFSAFYDYLLPELPGCTTALLDLHLRDVARDYCTHAQAWVAPLLDLAIDPAATSYPLQMPLPNTDLSRLLKMTGGSGADDPCPTLYWQAIEPPTVPRNSFTTTNRTPYPRYRVDQPPFTLSSDGSSISFTQPVDDPVVTFTAAIKPTIAATTLPDFLLLDQLDAIRCGVFARLKRMSGKPWSDPNSAVESGREWQGWINHQAAEALRGNQRALLRSTKTSI